MNSEQTGGTATRSRIPRPGSVEPWFTEARDECMQCQASLVRTTGVAIVLAAAFAGLSIWEGLREPKFGTFPWQVVGGSRVVRLPFVVPAYADPGGWLVMAICLVSPIIFVRQWRAQCMLLASLVGQDAAAKDLELPKRQLSRATPLKTMLFVLLACAITTFGQWAIFNAGPWHGLLAHLTVGGRLRATASLAQHWWLNPGSNPETSVIFGLIGIYGIYFGLKHVAFGIDAARVAGVVKNRTDVYIEIDPKNRDGHYGVGTVRSVLGGVVATTIMWLVLASIVLYLWIGENAVTMAIGGLLVVLAIFGLALPMNLVAFGIKRGKERAIKENTEQLAKIEGLADSGDPVTNSDLVGQRWTVLRAQRDAILTVPSTGFRYREFAASALTMALIPALLVVLGALVK